MAARRNDTTDDQKILPDSHLQRLSILADRPSIRPLRRWGLLGMNGKKLGELKSQPFAPSSRPLLAAYRGVLLCVQRGQT